MKIFILILLLIIFAGPTSAISNHPIQIRQAADGSGGEFYDTRNNSGFVLRGHNYVLLHTLTDSNNDGQADYPAHSNFATDKYDPNNSEQFLSQMSHDGYNTVRVFIGYQFSGQKDGLGIDQKYADNFIDFLNRAKKYNIFVIPVFDSIPANGGYLPTNENSQITGNNSYYLVPSYINAKKRFLVDFISYLIKNNAATDFILGYSIENEFTYYLNQKPFTLNSGIIQTATGNYDISIPSQKKQMMDANMVNYSNQIQSAIKSIDPTALVNIGFFSPQADPVNRIHSPYWIFADPDKGGSSIDFVDLHFYPLFGSVAQHISAFEITSKKKPVIMGEFGADKVSWQKIEDAAYKVRDMQVESCPYHIRGWLFWGWGQPAINWTGYYSTEENSGVINGQLAPINRSNPCIASFTPLVPTPTLTPTFISQKTGDANGDSLVNLLDFSIWKTEYLRSQSTKTADFNKDNLVNLSDFAIWKNRYLGL